MDSRATSESDVSSSFIKSLAMFLFFFFDFRVVFLAFMAGGFAFLAAPWSYFTFQKSELAYKDRRKDQ